MASNQNRYPVQEVIELRQQGLTDALIEQELSQRGYQQQQIISALSQADGSSMPDEDSESYPPKGYSGDDFGMEAAPSRPKSQPLSRSTEEEGNIYERIEEIAESMIDEKWDELIGEVKKIIAWKEKIEEKQTKMMNDLEKLKEDFKLLHQGVLGRLEDYDTRMSEVGTELKAVSKVFKDVIPEFVDNVKELKDLTQILKEDKG